MFKTGYPNIPDQPVKDSPMQVSERENERLAIQVIDREI